MIPLCNYCQSPYTYNHEETCDKINHVRKYRHDAFRNLIYRTILDKNKKYGIYHSTRITLEEKPFINDTSNKRIDIRISGPNSANVNGIDFDFAVTALTKTKLDNIRNNNSKQHLIDDIMQIYDYNDNDNNPTNNNINHNDNNNINENNDNLTPKECYSISKDIISDVERKKFNKYPRCLFPFKPLVITTGGTMNSYFRELIDNELLGFKTKFKRECSAILVKYSSMLFPRERRNVNFAPTVEHRVY